MAAKNVINASIVIDIRSSSGAEGGLSAEIDSRPDGLNGGVTTFYEGDNPGILLFKTGNVVNVEGFATDGHITHVGSGTMEVTEWVTFANTNTASASKDITGGFTILKAKGDSLPDIKYSGTTITCSRAVLAVLQIRYTARFVKYRLVGAEGDAPVVVMFSGDVYE